MSKWATIGQNQASLENEKIATWTKRIPSAAKARSESKSGKRGWPGGGRSASGAVSGPAAEPAAGSCAGE